MPIIVLAGQSNALGYLNDGPAPFTSFGNVGIWNPETRGWEVMIPGYNTGTPKNPYAWGPEVAFAMRFREDYPTEFLSIIKCVKGSTNLVVDWSPNASGGLFDATAATITEACSNWNARAPDFLLWMQGEADAAQGNLAQAYPTALAVYLAALPRWGLSAARCAVAAVSPTLPFALPVRSAQLATESPVDTLLMERGPDGLHLSREGQLSLGNAFYEAWKRTQL